MKTPLEEELGATLAARAATLRPEAGTRLRSIDYHPRRHGRALPVGLGAGAAAGAATAGTVLALVLGGATPAYAGWSATPTSSAPSSSAAPDCISTLSSASSDSSGSGAAAGTGTWQSLLTDVRGPFTVTLLQDGTSYATCFTGPSFTEVNRITSPSSASAPGEQTGSLSVSSQSSNGGASRPTGGVGSMVSLEGTGSGDLSQILQNQLTTSADGPYTFIDGRVASGVTAVTLVLRDGQDVASTVADGWFVAWWPGPTDANSAQVTKASGTTSEPFVPLSEEGMKLPLGQGNSASGVSVPPSAQPGTCAGATSTTSTSTTSTTGKTGTGGQGVDCKSPADKSTGNSGTASTGSSGNTGGTGSGPATKSNP